MRSVLDRWRSPVWQPERYRGQKSVFVVATQLESRGLTRSEERRVLENWIEFFSKGRTPIRRLSLGSRVPQNLLDSLAEQTQLEKLDIKWGDYSDLGALSGLKNLKSLSLGGASSVTDLTPLVSLAHLEVLGIDEAFQVKNLDPLSSLLPLRDLTFGNSHPGSDRNVEVRDLAWTRSLRHLETLRMPGSQLLDPDLSSLLELPRLVHLDLPLRRAYRNQVLEHATRSKAFAKLATAYEDRDTYLAGSTPA